MLHFCLPIVMQMRIRVESEGRRKEHLEVKFGMKHGAQETIEKSLLKEASDDQKRTKKWDVKRGKRQFPDAMRRWHRQHCTQCSWAKSQFGLERLLKALCHFRPPSSDYGAGNLSVYRPPYRHPKPLDSTNLIKDWYQQGIADSSQLKGVSLVF